MTAPTPVRPAGLRVSPAQPGPGVGDVVLRHLGVLATYTLRLTGRFAVLCVLAMLAIAVVPIALITGGWGALLWFAAAYRAASFLRRRRHPRRMPDA